MKQPWCMMGWLWSLPLTIIGALIVFVPAVVGWYCFAGRHGDALVWTVDEKAPVWLKRVWHRWTGLAIGNVVVLNGNLDEHRGRVTLRHEQEHVHQAMVFGVTLPVLYSLVYVGLKFCRHAHPFYDNVFEIDARRAAGQTIDVIGALKRAVVEGRLKLPKRNT